MKNQEKITIFNGKPCIIEESKFPVLFSHDHKINGKIIGIRGNGVMIEGVLEAQKNIANGYSPSKYSHEIFAHEDGEKQTIKYYKSKTKGQKLHTLLFVNADHGMAFGKPSEETTNVVNYLKGKMHNKQMN